MEWYHEAHMHLGQARMEETMSWQLTWLGCTADVARFTKSCKVCQQCKSTNIGRFRKIPLRDNIHIKLWEILLVNLVGPWKTKIKYTVNKKKVGIKIWALMMMDDASGWIKIIPINNKRSREIVLLVDSKQFCWYSRPLVCWYDNGQEFKGREFQELTQSYGVAPKPTMVKNPQGNASHERVHLVMAKMLRTQVIKIDENMTPN